MGERNVTPSSLMSRCPARLHTWKPPESVRIGPSQCMKRCRPPRSRMTSEPGRSIKWNVLARIMAAPTASSSSGVTALTEAHVPTGMKTGVSTTPCASVSRPWRASLSSAMISKCTSPLLGDVPGDRRSPGWSTLRPSRFGRRTRRAGNARIDCGATGRLELAARGVVLLEDDVERGDDLAEMGSRKRHRGRPGGVERAVGAHEEQTGLVEPSRLLDAD